MGGSNVSQGPREVLDSMNDSRCYITRITRLPTLCLFIVVGIFVVHFVFAIARYELDINVPTAYAEFDVWGAPIRVIDVLTSIGAVVAGWSAIAEIRASRAVRRAKDFNYRCCAACAYDLSRCAESGSCPECGAEYRFEDLPALWDGARFAFPWPRPLRRRSRGQPSGKEPDGGGTGTDFRELPRFDA